MSVVRATAVRGHLRFWWRAVRGWRAGGSLERLWELESALFGSAGEGGASPLSVEVEVLREGEKVGIAQYGRAVQWYLGFPLRGDKEWAPVKEGVAFRLRLRFPEKVGELNFWEELGGRPLGLGDLRGDRGPDPEGLWRPPAPGGRGAGGGGDPREASPVWPKSRVARRGAPPHPKKLRAGGAPLLERTRRALPGLPPGPPRGDPRSPGRSYWPEPDGVRRLTGRHAPHHLPRHPVHKFPRAHFGLPIIFHFKDRGDPPDTTLRLKEADRRASPLLFRPLGEGQKPCVVAVLEGARFPGEKLVLEGKDGRTWDVDPWLTPEEAQKIPVLGGEVDPVLAFVKSL